jgi:hypothetical protein
MGKNNCAWCQIDTNKQTKYSIEEVENGICPSCGSYNDAGQKNISINSMKQTYEGTLRLLQDIVNRFNDILMSLGVSHKDFEEAWDVESSEEVSLTIANSQIVRELFLSSTPNAGGTSTGNLLDLLGIKEDDVNFPLSDYGFSDEEE